MHGRRRSAAGAALTLALAFGAVVLLTAGAGVYGPTTAELARTSLGAPAHAWQGPPDLVPPMAYRPPAPPEPEPQPRPWDMNRGPNWTDRVLLTYDDCLNDQYHFMAVMDHVYTYNIGLLLFITTDCVAMHASRGFDIVGYARERGQWVANHTVNHPDLTTLSAEAIVWQTSGEPVSNLVRAPWGSHSPHVHYVLESVGRRNVHWSLDTEDWRGYSKHEVVARVVNYAEPGSNVLMHFPHQGFSIEAIEHIRVGLAERGLELCRAWPEPTGTHVPDNIC